MKNSVYVEVDTPKGKATLVEVYLTELGYLMAKVYHPNESVWTNYKIGEIGNLVESLKMKVLSSNNVKPTPSKKKLKEKVD